MSEQERGESRSVGAFLLGFLLGVLVTLGGAGSFFLVTQRAEVMRAREAMMQAEAARAEAERAREMAERAQQMERRARKAEQEAKNRAEKKGEQGEAKGGDLEAENKAAQAGLKTLETAIKAHKVAHREYPNTLAELTMAIGDRPAALEKVALVDPWGRAYLYEPGKTNPRTGVPQIYSLGPDPKDEKGRIYNWQ